MDAFIYRVIPERWSGDEGTTHHSERHGIVPGAYYQAGQLAGPVAAITKKEWLTETARHLQWGRVQDLKPPKLSSWSTSLYRVLYQRWYKNRRVIIARIHTKSLVSEGIEFRVARDVYRERDSHSLGGTAWPARLFLA